MTISNYRELAVWAKAMRVATSVYELADLMPPKEQYRLTAQLIRAAISIPANIAEGHTRAARKDYAHFVSIARGSAAELQTLLILAESASLIPSADIAPTLAATAEVGRMLNVLHAKLKIPNP